MADSVRNLPHRRTRGLGRVTGHLGFLPILLAVLVCVVAGAERSGWLRETVDWRAGPGRRVRAIRHPVDRPVVTRRQRPVSRHRLELRSTATPSIAAAGAETPRYVYVNVIDSPPIDGFVPWVVVGVTDGTAGWDFNGYPSAEVFGDYLTGSPETDFAVAIFDTGASASLFSVSDVVKTGIYGAGMVTTLPVELTGATGTAVAYTTDPLGIFVGGLDVLDANGLLTDDSALLGEYNVSVLAGDAVESPNLPTAVGSPLAVFLSAAFCNNREAAVTVDGNDFYAPHISFYSLGDSSVPSYSSGLDLQLRPSDGSAVQYMPCEVLWMCGDEPDGTPVYPSTIWGMASAQSLYFVPWVNVADGGYSVSNLTDFMFDTGAQITVISRTVAAGLHLDLENPDFDVEIQDVTGAVTIEPGFYLDSLQIPAEGQWLEYTNAPVVVINVDSPEGGTLQGIVGMNLFVDLNFVFKGGGMMGQGYTARLEFEPACRIAGDIAGDCYQCRVDYEDLAALCDAWLGRGEPRTANWNPNADIAPPAGPDGSIDFLDFAVLASNWLQSGP